MLEMCGWRNGGGGLGEVEEQHLRSGGGRQLQRRGAGERGGIAGPERLTVEGDLAGGDVKPGVATGDERVRVLFAGREAREMEIGVLEAHGAISAFFAAIHHLQAKGLR